MIDQSFEIIYIHKRTNIRKYWLQQQQTICGGVGLLDGLVKVANSKGQTDRLARILWLRGH